MVSRLEQIIVVRDRLVSSSLRTNQRMARNRNLFLKADHMTKDESIATVRNRSVSMEDSCLLMRLASTWNVISALTVVVPSQTVRVEPVGVVTSTHHRHATTQAPGSSWPTITHWQRVAARNVSQKRSRRSLFVWGFG